MATDATSLLFTPASSWVGDDSPGLDITIDLVGGDRLRQGTLTPHSALGGTFVPTVRNNADDAFALAGFQYIPPPNVPAGAVYTDVISFTNTGQAGTDVSQEIIMIVIHMVSPDSILLGVQRGDTVMGDFRVPDPGTVLDGTPYGVGGTGSQGQFIVPATNKVLSGTQFGTMDNQLQGIVDLPGVNVVLAGATYGEPQGGPVGIYVVPDPTDVRSGVNYGPVGQEGEQFGTLISDGGGSGINGSGILGMP